MKLGTAGIGAEVVTKDIGEGIAKGSKVKEEAGKFLHDLPKSAVEKLRDDEIKRQLDAREEKTKKPSSEIGTYDYQKQKNERAARSGETGR